MGGLTVAALAVGGSAPPGSGPVERRGLADRAENSMGPDAVIATGDTARLWQAARGIPAPPVAAEPRSAADWRIAALSEPDQATGRPQADMPTGGEPVRDAAFAGPAAPADTSPAEQTPVNGTDADGTDADTGGVAVLGADGGAAGRIGPEGGMLAVLDKASTPLGAATGSDTGLRTPPTVVRQVIEAVHGSANRQVELILNPDELGKVQLTLSTRPDAVSMIIVADRPDTLDLMRRNIDGLAQELRNMGYANVSFDFGQSPRQGHPSAQSGVQAQGTDWRSAEALAPVHPPALAPQAVQGSGLDLRL